MTRSMGLVVFTAAIAAASAAGAAEKPAKGGAKASKPASAAAASSDVVAYIGDQPLTIHDFEEAAGSKLFQIRTQQYQAQRQILDEEIGRRLLAKEAQSRHLSEDELIQQEVEAKVPPVPEAEQKSFYEANKSRFGSMPEADAMKRIETGLRQQKVADRRAEFTESLRKAAGVRVMLDPPRMSVPAGDNPARGPADAPVTIIEFSDFQCPFCSRVTGTIKKLEETYPGKIRLVYRNFPLVQIHPQAARAAEAGACANDQGKFWAMHDELFGHQDKLQDADLKQHAADVGLDAAAFNACLDSGKHASDWQKALTEGQNYGVASTPAFFINGRMIVGAQPYENFARVVEEELARAGQPAAPKSAPASSPSGR